MQSSIYARMRGHERVKERDRGDGKTDRQTDGKRERGFIVMHYDHSVWPEARMRVETNA